MILWHMIAALDDTRSIDSSEKNMYQRIRLCNLKINIHFFCMPFFVFNVEMNLSIDGYVRSCTKAWNISTKH